MGFHEQWWLGAFWCHKLWVGRRVIVPVGILAALRRELQELRAAYVGWVNAHILTHGTGYHFWGTRRIALGRHAPTVDAARGVGITTHEVEDLPVGARGEPGDGPGQQPAPDLLLLHRGAACDLLHHRRQ